MSAGELFQKLDEHKVGALTGRAAASVIGSGPHATQMGIHGAKSGLARLAKSQRTKRTQSNHKNRLSKLGEFTNPPKWDDSQMGVAQVLSELGLGGCLPLLHLRGPFGYHLLSRSQIAAENPFVRSYVIGHANWEPIREFFVQALSEVLQEITLEFRLLVTVTGGGSPALQMDNARSPSKPSEGMIFMLIAVPFGCFARKIDGPGLAGG